MQVRLAAKDLACRRGDRLLFSGFACELGPGDALHVTGPNGVGKSSLLRLLAGLMRPFEGRVAREGGLALLDERLALDEYAPLGKALGFWERLDGCEEPYRALMAMELEPLLDIPVRYLSTGQRKRAAIARMLNYRRPIWLLDEPLNGLDEAAREKLEALIALHCGNGGICVTASHQAIALPHPQIVALAEYAP